MKHTEEVQAALTDEGRYRLLVHAITDYAIYMLDPNGIVTSWNAGAERFKGYSASEIVGQHFSRFYTEEDLQAGLPDRALTIAANEGRFENEGWRVRKDGSRFWAQVVIDPIREPSGTLLGFAKITRDLTERRRAEEKLRRSEELFRLLVGGVTDYAIYMLDPEGRVTSWNQGAQRIKGYLPDEIIGEHFSRFYTEEDQQENKPQRALETAASEGRYESEAERVRKDGSRFWAHVVIDRILDESGKLIGFAKITRDVTERRTAELALEQAREALFQSQKTQALGQLTGGIAHDFNNLLMAVLGSLELLRKRLPDDPRLLRLLDNAVQGAQRGASLTQRMLAFARRQELNPEPVDLPELLHGMKDLMCQSLGSSVLIETRLPLALPPVHVDANQLEAALLNLVVNARDAMPNGGQIIVAACEEAITTDHRTGLEPGQYVCLSLTDDGEGMDEATLANAVDPFYTTKEVGKGTGLGLSMVQGLAEQSGGRLVLVSQKGEGTTAELWLPVSKDVTVSSHGSECIEDSPLSSPSLVVVAVDDDGLVLMNTAAMLEDLGHTVFEAASGREALDILRREKTIDLIISDQAMPHMTGVQLAEAVKAEWPKLPIILATGHADFPRKVASDLPTLAKPFSQKVLAQAIASVVQRTRTDAPDQKIRPPHPLGPRTGTRDRA